MLTYLYLHLNKWKKRPFLSLFVLLFPLIVTVSLFPFFQKAMEESAVPVALVDEDESRYSTTLTERVKDADRLRVLSMSFKEAERAVKKGTIEAAFILKEGFEETLQNGEIDDTITWIRSENSTLDVFAKEAIGAELMRLSLNAKAGNALMKWDSSATFEEGVQYADQFWNPEPLFQVAFEKRSPENVTEPSFTLSPWQGVMISLFFLYAWIAGIVFLRNMVWDLRSGRLQRIKMTQQTTRAYFAGHCFVLLLVGAATFLPATYALLTLSQTPILPVLEWSGWGVIVLLITLGITWFLFMGLGRKNGSILFLVLLATGSFVWTTAQLDWAFIWPHHWLIHKP
ncbi:MULTISPECIES: ABC transporter permease [Pontibacillus]|uniref:ABC transporter permease n=1 Tax=Pontibacillus chungwhensis TaxID=265426 RepID=A0ABY8UZK2_9BACI|nr:MULTISPECIES: ABC transporter permease [Pontibacillus]MCD5324850.1 ABC transporter permease [Pontibacillus sp. HN14]WIF98808.1 ABC transporter permease [Pontibacillus chungwhensis]